MAYIHAMSASLLSLFLLSLIPFSHPLSTVAVSEINNQTLVCAVVKSGNNYQDSSSPSLVVNCTSFPQRAQIQLTPAVPSVSAIVGGNGFLCVLSSSYSSNKSLIFCWRFANLGDNMDRKRVYNGSYLRELSSANTRFCGVHNGSDAAECWPRRDGGGNGDGEALSSSLAVGEGFMCGVSESGAIRCAGSDRGVTDHVPNGTFTGVEAGFRHACGVAKNGSLECWGDMGGEMMPQGEFKEVALGERRGCAIRANETVVCWGEEGFSLGESLRNERFVAIEAKQKVFCGVVKSNYSLLCWGDEGFDSNPIVFDDVVPAPCRPEKECSCGPWANSDKYCGEGLMICEPCPVAMAPPLPPEPSVAPPSSRPTASKKWSGRNVAFLVIGCVGVSSSLLALCVFLFRRYFKIRGSRIHDSGRLEEGEGEEEGGGSPQQGGEPAPPRALEKKLSHLISTGNGGHLEEFSLEVLLIATDNFSEELKIGNGSFGSVYHATLDDGRQVAIKRAETSASSSYAIASKRDQEDRDNAFLNELEFLSRLNHKNLVRLLGYCEESNVLVYEYMDNGTLSDHLHKLQSTPLMSWPKRIKVALDAARGIEYLHEYAVPRIIHRDIKSSSILLDSRWNAKVSDFGLSLLGPQDDEESNLSLRPAGTMGYMDPEYYRLQLLTTKSDVYSFGVVLLELLSGCKAIYKNENGEPRNVVDYVVPYIIQDNISRVLDRRAPPPTPFEIEAVAYVGYLAADCVMLEGRDRPTMSEVVNSLDRALEACLAIQILSRSASISST